jgi:esterase/lipase superfamily enzyme
MAGGIPELSLRDPAPEGTRVANEVHASPRGFAPRSHRLILLVHGYNNTHRVASDSYEDFCARLEELGIRRVSLLGEICAVHWPGNSKLGALSFASYPTEIKPAVRSAEALAAFLGGLRGPQNSALDIVLICHSLGNRLGLELVRFRIAAPDPMVEITGLCLMAAAVPVRHVDDGRLAAAARATRTRALFSRGDKVLRFAFPIGQTLAADGFFPQAVGRFGHPLSVWGDVSDLSPYAHGDYWHGGPKDDPDMRSVRQAAAFLGAPVPRDLPKWSLIRHDLAPVAELAEREIPRRTPPSRTL